ncbi:HDOD domain-containing protein [Arcobacter sp. FWKO B]|uniref:HDOD domain-containing protein n=1 Tax=Arcobacter sp. FWKO B TaxID=2593672 RepID=UPI0018A6228C|nr:HDOD domain-containing protein [Arcobacter sp. FWKO B]QOG11838.1 HDOD domain-containing protein [Arcobacter sp. FWKO B]
MTNLDIMSQIDSLPPLPQTVIELESFKKSASHEVSDLIKIIEKDPLIVSTLLKVSNSAMFGFVSKIETPSRAVNLLGINFTLSIALASSMKKSINTDLQAYGKDSDDFLRLANMQSNLINLWIGKIDLKLRDELILPAFLQESGKFLVSDYIKKQKKESDFLQAVTNNPDKIAQIEKDFTGVSTSQITSAIFKHWGLDGDLVNDIYYADSPFEAPLKYQKNSIILGISKLVCNIISPFDEVCIQKAKKLVVDNGYTTKEFDNAINKLQDRLLDEE